MLDFLKISERSKKQGVTEIYPLFVINNKSTPSSTYKKQLKEVKKNK